MDFVVVFLVEDFVFFSEETPLVFFAVDIRCFVRTFLSESDLVSLAVTEVGDSLDSRLAVLIARLDPALESLVT